MGWSTVAGDSGSPAGVPTPCWGPGLPSSSLHQPLHLMEMLSLNHHTGSQQPSPYLLQTKEHILGGICSIRALGSLVFHLSSAWPGSCWRFLLQSTLSWFPPWEGDLEGKRVGCYFFFSPQQKEGKIYVISVGFFPSLLFFWNEMGFFFDILNIFNIQMLRICRTEQTETASCDKRHYYCCEEFL